MPVKIKGKSKVKSSTKVQRGGDISQSISTCPPGVFCLDNIHIFLAVLLIVTLVVFFFKKQDYNPFSQWMSPQEEPRVSKSSQQQPPEQKTSEHMYGGEYYPPIPPRDFIVNKERERLINPLLPPERSNVLTEGGLPIIDSPNSINIHTRGYSGGYQQIGLLYKNNEAPNDDNNNILPLFGRPTFVNSNKWNYYTSSDKFHSLKIPITIKGRRCTDEQGCTELYDGDTVMIPPYKGDFKVEIYGYDSPKYLPQIW
jgi:hypothetical protein